MLGDDIGVRKMSESGEPERDFPLGFHWSTDQDLIGGLGLPAARNDHYQEARNAVLTAAYLAGKPGRWVSYSRRRAFYAARHRYQGLAFTYRTVLSAVADGVEAAQLHAEIIYGLRNIPLIGDAYETGQSPRDHGKRAFNVGVNAKNRRSAVAAIAKDLNSLKAQMRQRPAGSQCEWSGRR
jgi:hypothetical protein